MRNYVEKTVYLYDNTRPFGVSEHLAQTYEGGDCEELVVGIPEEFDPYESVTGDTVLTIDGYRYFLDEVVFSDDTGRSIFIAIPGEDLPRKIKILSRNGRRSTGIPMDR